MILFFRKIRQKLLTQNKFSKYLFYAIGEIALVMIGILLALQINNRNEDAKNRVTEASYISSLHKDFLRNKPIEPPIKSPVRLIIQYFRTKVNPSSNTRKTFLNALKIELKTHLINEANI